MRVLLIAKLKHGVVIQRVEKLYQEWRLSYKVPSEMMGHRAWRNYMGFHTSWFPDKRQIIFIRNRILYDMQLPEFVWFVNAKILCDTQ